MKQREIIRTARQFIGTPFIPQGRKRGVGVDCIGLLSCVAQINNLKLQDKKNYLPQQWAGDKLLHEVQENFTPLANLENACILLIWFRRPCLPQHFAIYTDNKTIIHTTEDLKKVVEVNYDEQWIKRTHSIWRFREKEV
jgi:cell wall-associated NlpC family hydrolase